jgi:hypothetical protein
VTKPDYLTDVTVPLERETNSVKGIRDKHDHGLWAKFFNVLSNLEVNRNLSEGVKHAARPAQLTVNLPTAQ